MMRFAYADPPYPGNAELYAGHPDYAGEVDHAELVDRLERFDGWALSTSSKSLRYVLDLCPPDTRVLIWLNHSIGRAWEPVLLQRPAARPLPSTGRPTDWIETESEYFQWRPVPDGYVIGRKPREFCRWLFRWLGAVPAGDDTLDDLFPGSGAVTDAWREWNEQPELVGMDGATGAPVPGAPDRWAVRRWRRDRPGWLTLDVD